MSKIFVSVAPGLEKTLKDEIESGLHIKINDHVIEGEGGFEVNYSPETLHKICLGSAVAESVRVRVAEPFRAGTPVALTGGLGKLPWSLFLPRNSYVNISLSIRTPKIPHTGLIKQTVEAFFEKKLKCHVVKRTPAQENASTEKGEEEESVEAKKSQRKEASDKQAEVQPFVHTVFIRIVSSSVTVSINAASEMYKRNISPKWVSEAPLRETLAAAIVRTATEQVLAEIKPKRRKDPIEYTHTIWDPFCGAGTILLEAVRQQAFRGANREFMTPNLNMKFDFEHWPVHDPAEFAQAKRQILRQYDNYEGALVGEFAEVRYFGNDISGKAIESARHNFEVHYADPTTTYKPQCDLVKGDFEKMADKLERDQADTITIITNPPYGKRIETPHLFDTFKRFGKILKRREDLKHVYVLNGSKAFIQCTDLKWKSILQFRNRGLPVRLLKLIR